MISKDYTIDGEPVTWRELIARATSDAGYEGDGGMFTTSGAAAALRSCGYTVDSNPEKVTGAD